MSPFVIGVSVVLALFVACVLLVFGVMLSIAFQRGNSALVAEEDSRG